MRAFAISQFGEPGSVVERPTPIPQPGEVLVRVRAAGVNAMDPILASGAYQAMMEHRLPLTPGLDMSGTVEAVGPDVEDLRVGDEVYGRSTKPYYGEGTLARVRDHRPEGPLAQARIAQPCRRGRARDGRDGRARPRRRRQPAAW